MFWHWCEAVSILFGLDARGSCCFRDGGRAALFVLTQPPLRFCCLEWFYTDSGEARSPHDEFAAI